jgi:hypothetical protein
MTLSHLEMGSNFLSVRRRRSGVTQKVGCFSLGRVSESPPPFAGTGKLPPSPSCVLCASSTATPQPKPRSGAIPYACHRAMFLVAHIHTSRFSRHLANWAATPRRCHGCALSPDTWVSSVLQVSCIHSACSWPPLSPHTHHPLFAIACITVGKSSRACGSDF